MAAPAWAAASETPQQRVGPEPRFVRRTVQFQQTPIDCQLIGRIEPDHGRRNLLLDVGDCLQHAPAVVARRVAVAQLAGFGPSGAGAEGTIARPNR